MKFWNVFAIVILFSIHSQAAKDSRYNVSMRVGLKGATPLSVNTAVKSGKKSFISEISEDGQTETLVEVLAKKSSVKNRDGLLMDVTVTKRVKGLTKASERAQVFAPDNQEMEFGMGQKGRTEAKLSLAVMAHQL